MLSNRYQRIYNFSAGPSMMPEPVLEIARDTMMNYGKSGMSVMEMSHRSKKYESILFDTEAKIRQILGISDQYAVLFLQGGASLQFSMAPMNLRYDNRPIDVVLSGIWAEKAHEAMGDAAHIAASSKDRNYAYIPKNLTISPETSYLHLVSNNTIFGSQLQEFPSLPGVPLVVDMSSDICSRVIDMTQFGLVFAGAQKNLGPAGVTLVIVNRDLLTRCPKSVPPLLRYETHVKANSMVNTPPTYGIYIMGLVLDWILSNGGLSAIEATNRQKSAILYSEIDRSGFYHCPVDTEDRSHMNVVFRVNNGNSELEAKFIEEATAAGLVELKGHRSVGGLRASIYNAMPIDGIHALVQFMIDFETRYG